MQRKIEILAPAGSYESMKAAMNAGCDAVYIGGSKFGARAYADNPDDDTLLKAIDEAHIRSKKLYLTVNTLIKDRELEKSLYDFILKYYQAGLDAVIVQDVGVMHFIHRHFPDLPIHASTQTTITMAQGANYLKSMGVTRLVTARELSFKEIKEIRDNTDLEIETFVHGALCYCYSGQCLMSSLIGGRSGNRGRCAQPCRMAYRFYSSGKPVSSAKEPYLLSLKDINTLALIPDLIEAGVDSFKIEGRMKRPEYSAGVSYIYRKYVDLYLSKGRDKFYEFLETAEYKKDMLDLMDLYNRGGFSCGYGHTRNGKSMMSMSRPNHSGVPVGKVIGFEKSHVKISLVEDVNSQDVLEIRNNENEPVFEFTAKENTPAKGTITVRAGALPYTEGKKSGEIDIRRGYTVYRTKNNMLLDSIRERFIDKDSKREITGFLTAREGERLKLTLKTDDKSVTVYHNIVEAAKNQPMSADRLKEPVDRLGNTMFYFKKLSVDADENIFVPVAWLNDIRRQAVGLLSEAITGAFRRSVKNSFSYSLNYEESNYEETGKAASGNWKSGNLNISVSVETKDQLLAALLYPEVNAVYVDYDAFSPEQILNELDAVLKAGKELYVLLPHICRKTVYEKLKKDIVILANNENVKGFIIKNFEEAELIQGILKKSGLYKKIKLNYNMYVFNREAKTFWREKGINDFTAPLELNEKELNDLGLSDCELMVYGYLPVMVSAQCLYANTTGCIRGHISHDRPDYLTDRLGKKFYVKSICSSCCNIIYNGQRLSLMGQAEKVLDLKPYGIRLDFTFEDAGEVKKVLSAFIDKFIYGREVSMDIDNITTGHFRRGVE